MYIKCSTIVSIKQIHKNIDLCSYVRYKIDHIKCYVKSVRRYGVLFGS